MVTMCLQHLTGFLHYLCRFGWQDLIKMVLPPLLPSYLKALFCCNEMSSEEPIQYCRVGIGLRITWPLTASCSVLCTHFHYTVYTQQLDTCKRNQKTPPTPTPALFRSTVGILTWTAVYRTCKHWQTWLTMYCNSEVWDTQWSLLAHTHTNQQTWLSM